METNANMGKNTNTDKALDTNMDKETDRDRIWTGTWT